jgi:hypothetical protein
MINSIRCRAERRKQINSSQVACPQSNFWRCKKRLSGMLRRDMVDPFLLMGGDSFSCFHGLSWLHGRFSGVGLLSLGLSNDTLRLR